MELSVASRVKAHISTPYIDADGRGVARTDAYAGPACMLPPAEFAALQRSSNGLEQQLAEAEARHSAALVRLGGATAQLQADERERLMALAREANVFASDVAIARAAARESQRAAEAAALDQAYHQRNESAAAMVLFQTLSRRSDIAALRDREEAVTARHEQLQRRAVDARAAVEVARAAERTRHEELEAKAARELSERLRALADRDEAEARRRVREEVEAVQRERERAARLQREKDEIDRVAQLEIERYEARHAAAVEAAQRAARERVARERELLESEAAQANAECEVEYTRLKEIEVAARAIADQISARMHHVHGCGSQLSLLMEAAKARAEETHTVFHGLTLLGSATLIPSAYTPDARPAFSGPLLRTVTAQTTLSEPIRAAKPKRV